MELSVVIKLVNDQTSSDNNIRRKAELEFNQLVLHDPSGVAYILVQAILEPTYPIDIRQACLIHLRRLVVKHWSAGFELYSGISFTQEVKRVVRDSLIKLVVSTDNTKIRNGCSYVIVQIAVVDYPDEWPDLLQVLYEHTKDYSDSNSMKGGLQVLNDLFDDLVTEEQFWDQGLGSTIISHLIAILSQPELSSDIKLGATSLYKSVLSILQSPEAFNDPNRKKAVYDHIPISTDLYCQLLQKSVTYTKNTPQLYFTDFEYRTSIYSILSSLIGNFNKRIAPSIKSALLDEILVDLSFLQPIYLQIANGSFDLGTIIPSISGDAYRDITKLLNELISVLSLLQHSSPLGSNWDDFRYEQFVTELISLATLTNTLIDAYDADISDFVNDVTGLSGFVNVRDSILEFVSELNSIDSKRLFRTLSRLFLENKFGLWNQLESVLFLLESLFQNDESELDANDTLGQLLPAISALIILNNNTPHHSLLTSRVFLLLPKLFEKFESVIEKPTVTHTFLSMVEFTRQISGDNIIAISLLISCSSYASLIQLKEYIPESHKHATQESIFDILWKLLGDIDDDAVTVLLESLTVAINIDVNFAVSYQNSNSMSVIDFVLQIAFKNSSNIQVVVDSSNCLQVLFQNVSREVYIACCEKSLPVIFDLITESIDNETVNFSPKLDLGLELANIILETVPGGSLPPLIFNYTYPILKKLLLFATDDQILQSGGSVLNTLIQKAAESFQDYMDVDTGENGMQSLILIVSKFLSPQLSDKAASNCGNIVTSVINKFQQQLGDKFLSQILKSTAERLVIAKEVITIENLIMLFCNLVLISTESMIDFLNNEVILIDPKSGKEESGLALILPIWFQCFEVTRGYEKIKQNALALAKIYSLNDQRVENLIVNGDIIPYDGDKILTRSMTKLIPEQYTRISASLKILKLLVGELDFQCQQPKAEDYLYNQQETQIDDSDDGGWEDLEDIGIPSYDKLKSYIDSDDEDNNEKANDEDLKNLLVQFFRECASRNISNFLKYYELLGDNEKRVITENVLF